MNRRVTLFLTLIVSIIALLLLFLSYYGVIRYVQLQMSSSIEPYVHKYRTKPRGTKDRVVVSFTATDSELKNLEPFIKSLLDQTVRVDEIALTLPYSELGKVPAKWKDIITTYGISKDYGSANNTIPALLREPESNTRILVVQPSVIYGVDFVHALLEASDRNPDNIIHGGDGLNLRHGILVKPGLFTDRISRMEQVDLLPWLGNCGNNPKSSAGYKLNFPRWNYKLNSSKRADETKSP